MSDAKPELKMTTLDCADAEPMTRFWSELLGWEVVASGDGYAMLSGPAGAQTVGLGIGAVPDYQPPGWPNAGTKQFHFDLACDDIAAVEARAVGLGATVPDEQPGETWRVLLDPAGHPFCLTDAANW